jgi:hypothetical protein
MSSSILPEPVNSLVESISEKYGVEEKDLVWLWEETKKEDVKKEKQGCQYLVKKRGEKDKTPCNATVSKKCPYSQYCSRHLKVDNQDKQDKQEETKDEGSEETEEKVDKESVKSDKSNKSSKGEQLYCQVLLKRGVKKGEKCGEKVAKNSQDKCARHLKGSK